VNRASAMKDDPDPADVGAAFEAHAAALCRAMHAATGSRQMAEDIVQDVFAFAHLHRDELYEGPSLRVWLYRVAVNKMRHHIRSRSRFRLVLERLFAEWRPSAPLADEDLERRQHGERIHAAIQHIPEIYREVFVLFERHDLSGAEIALILDIEEATVWTRLHRARKAFRAVWTEEEEA
jgi:RNA polymerase sigma-70 factor (ECF subfamily)